MTVLIKNIPIQVLLYTGSCISIIPIDVLEDVLKMRAKPLTYIPELKNILIFDDNLNWSNHISYINSKIAKGLGIICRAKKYLTTTALINLYNALIFPYLIYCVEVWGNALSIHLTPLLKLQNKILRIITFTYHRIDKDKLYYNTGIVPFKVLVKHRIGLLMHTLSNGNVPKPLQNVYQCNKKYPSSFYKTD